MNNLPGLMQCDGAGGTPQLVATANAATAATSEEHRDRDWYLKQSPAVTQTQQPLDKQMRRFLVRREQDRLYFVDSQSYQAKGSCLWRPAEAPAAAATAAAAPPAAAAPNGGKRKKHKPK